MKKQLLSWIMASLIGIGCTDKRSGGGGSDSIDIQVTNYLLWSIDVYVDDEYIGTVSGGGTEIFETDLVEGLVVSYDLVRPTTTLGDPVGEFISAEFPPEYDLDPDFPLTYYVDNIIGADTYFAPVITNTSSTTLLMGVNIGLIDENLCNCTVLAGSSNIGIGYYSLYSNTIVRGYKATYGGTYVSWAYNSQFNSGNVQANSGRTNLLNSITFKPSLGDDPPMKAFMIERSKDVPRNRPRQGRL